MGLDCTLCPAPLGRYNGPVDGSRTFKYEHIAGEIADLIDSGTFRPGDTIPSVRELSRQHGVSIVTVLQAYYLLEARGLPWITTG